MAGLAADMIDAPSHGFQCRNSDCRAEYVAVLKSKA